MWRQEKKDSSIVSLALLLALATIPTTVTLLVPTPALAQSTNEIPAFPSPESVVSGTTVRIDGAKGLGGINQALKQSFEQQFSDTKVEVSANGTEAALQALLNGNVDVVALSRGLTPEEKAQGLEQVRLRREKIAIFVAGDNPFKGSLTNREFARIFRGEITNWSELGATKGQIRVIDHPTTSDTRNNLRSYPAFKTADFAIGANATQLTNDDTIAIIQKLGKYGISYALASQVSQLAKLQSVRILNIDQLSPDDSKYPFSQPLVYVYKQNPNPGIAGFLGFAIASPGQIAIDAARTAEANTISTTRLQALPTDAFTSPISEATTALTPAPITEVTTDPNVARNEQPVTTPEENNPNAINPALFLWLLLPALGGFLLWWFLGRNSSANEDTDKSLSTGEATAENTSSNLDAGTTLPASNAESVTFDNTVNQPAVVITSNSDEAAWEIEAPATVVNTSYPQLPDVPIAASETELQTSAISASNPQLTDIPEVSLDTDIWNDEPIQASNIIENTIPTDEAIWSDIQENNQPILNSNTVPELPEITLDGELPTLETSTTVSELPELPEVELNAVADAAESTIDFTEEDTIEVVSNLPEKTNEVLTNEADFTAEIVIGGAIPISNAQTANQSVTSIVSENTEANIILTAQSPELAYIAWRIPDSEQQALQNAGVNQLTLRLYDVTELDLSYQTPQIVQQYEVAAAAGDRFVAVPASDSDYITEIGYVTIGDRWVSIARSARVRVFNRPYVSKEPATPVLNENTPASIILTAQSAEWVYTAWHIADSEQQALQNAGVNQLTLRLYDATGLDLSYQTPQIVQQYEVAAAAGDRFVAVPASDSDYIAEIGYVKDGSWVSIARSARVRVFNRPYVSKEPATPVLNENTPASIILTAQSAEWVYTAWHIADSEQQALQNAGVNQLTLRLYDATGLDLSYQTPQIVQQYEVAAAAGDRFVAVPASDSDYIAEIGYVKDGSWVSIARSARVRVFNRPYVTEEPATVIDQSHSLANTETSVVLIARTPKWAYAAWQISDQQKQALQNAGVNQLALRLYDVTEIDLSYQSPQFIQQYECEEITRDRFVAIPTIDRDYIVEIGYVVDGDRWVSIARSASIRVFSRPHPGLWFVADTELIIHGATEPGTTVTVGGNTIKLKPDGTFHLRIPFSDSLIEYLLTAVAADGEQARNIHKKFSQEYPEV
ncbi:MAG: DUF4912 domain-containing protein [Goleter apudmare HA4340-LM2]|jgi:phosphate transport system substrate-binding protein|nr:DUF4912 domain-containing protein [Goleter apudmare HA4340-LM2]